jgi:hypothetical protein
MYSAAYPIDSSFIYSTVSGYAYIQFLNYSTYNRLWSNNHACYKKNLFPINILSIIQILYDFFKVHMGEVVPHEGCITDQVSYLELK